MTEASWMPVVVDPLVPRARLGALLVQRRTEQGLSIDQLAARSAGMFTVSYLQNAERGQVPLDERVVGHLVGLYQVDSDPVVPERAELILDLDRQQLGVGDQLVDFDSMVAQDILSRYVSLIYLLRGADFGTELVLRDDDLTILGRALGYGESQLRTEIHQLIEAPDSVTNAKSVGKLRMIAAAGVLVGITAVGALVLVGGQTSDAPESSAEVLGATQTAASLAQASSLGASAEALVDFDFRAALPGWTITYADDHPAFLGVTRSEDKQITIHVEPEATPELVAAVLMHEVGHAIDLEQLTDQERSEWISLRDMPATWWPGNGLNDFSVGAGDFAEAVSALTTNSPSSSAYGAFTDEQLAFVAQVLDRTQG